MSVLSWETIRAWQELTGTELTPNDARLIRKLSLIYVSQYTTSKDIKITAPYPDLEYVAQHAAQQRKLKK